MEVILKEGWAPTRTGEMLHYWGIDRKGVPQSGNDIPLALCHNALRVRPDAELQADAPAAGCCTSCLRYLPTRKQREAHLSALAKEVSSELGPGAQVKVTRGKLAGRRGEVERPDDDFPGFWWVWVLKGNGDFEPPVMLSAGQLEIKK